MIVLVSLIVLLRGFLVSTIFRMVHPYILYLSSGLRVEDDHLIPFQLWCSKVNVSYL